MEGATIALGYYSDGESSRLQHPTFRELPRFEIQAGLKLRRRSGRGAEGAGEIKIKIKKEEWEGREGNC